MRGFFLFLKGVITILAIFALHTLVAYATPYPLYEVHVIYLFLIWLLIRNQKTKALWLALIFGYLTELFSAEYFGVHTLALVFSVYGVSWLIEKIFTNNAWYIISVLGVSAILVHRVLFIVISSGTHRFNNFSSYLTLGVLQSMLVEMFVNTLSLVALYLLSRAFGKRVNPRYAQ